MEIPIVDKPEWTSSVITDFCYLPDPRATPEYEEEARHFIASIRPDMTKRKEKNSPFGWPDLILEMNILRLWPKSSISTMLGTRVETHLVRYLCLLVSNLEPDPWFQEKVWSFYDTRKRGRQITNWFGSQNCLAPDTKVRMFDCSVRRTADVCVGDQLMGDDSKPRRVLSTCRGRTRMFRVTPKIGLPYECTGNHLVTVVRKRDTTKTKRRTGEILEISASELAGYSTAKMDSFGLKSAATEYSEQCLPWNPYIYGLWLGDGDRDTPVITSMDTEVIEAWTQHFTEKGFAVSVGKQKNPSVKRLRATRPHQSKQNPFLNFIRTSSHTTKFILPIYLKASVEQRMQLLAGIIDTDGHMAVSYTHLTLPTICSV